MDLTLRSYLSNPYGKGNTTVPNIYSIKNTYLDKLRQMGSKIAFKWYQFKEKSFICHLMIPSESAEGVHYDVVFEFSYPTKEYTSKTVLDLPLRVFSNSPSFSYTYAHVFLKEKLLCDWLKNKYTKNVRKNVAGVRNSANIVGFEKTFYLSALFLTMNGRSDLSFITSTAEKISSTNEIEKEVLSQDDVESKYRNTKQQLREQKKIERKHAEDTKKNFPAKRDENHTKSIEKVSKVSSIKTGEKVKASGRSKRIKKI